MSTRRDYEAAAEAIKSTLYEAPTGVYDWRLYFDACESIAEKLADHFARDNPRFDRVLFLGRCGLRNG